VKVVADHAKREINPANRKAATLMGCIFRTQRWLAPYHAAGLQIATSERSCLVGFSRKIDC
jgi:hypothetical protein